MPTAPDQTWNQLLALLDDNGVGGISEEDVRSLARFARTSYAFAGASGASLSGATWHGTLNSTPTPGGSDIPRYIMLTQNKSYQMSENYLSISSIGFSYSAAGGATDSVVASRLLKYSWNIELFSSTLEHCAIAFWYLPVATTGWPNLAKRHRIGRMYPQTSWTGSAPGGLDQVFHRSGDGYMTMSSGSGMIVLNPGDQLVPVMEHYGPDTTLSTAQVSFNIDAFTAGVVSTWSPLASYWDAVADITGDKANPFVMPTTPRLWGMPTT